MLLFELDDLVNVADVRFAVLHKKSADFVDITANVRTDRLEERSEQINEFHQIAGRVQEGRKQQTVVVVLFELVVSTEEALRFELSTAFEHGAA